MSGLILPLGGRREAPALPADVVDEIILWFRQQGRQASVAWNAVVRCPEVRIRLLADDPRLKAHQRGEWADDFESMFLHHPGPGGAMVAYNLADLGASGVRNLLDEANLWSGSGKYRSLSEALAAVHEKNDALKESIRRAAIDNSAERARERWRQDTGVPLVPVGIQL